MSKCVHGSGGRYDGAYAGRSWRPTGRSGAEADGELSGVDLVRVALEQARLAAKKDGGEARAPRRLRWTAVNRDGQKPSGGPAGRFSPLA